MIKNEQFIEHEYWRRKLRERIRLFIDSLYESQNPNDAKYEIQLMENDMKSAEEAAKISYSKTLEKKETNLCSIPQKTSS